MTLTLESLKKMTTRRGKTGAVSKVKLRSRRKIFPLLQCLSRMAFGAMPVTHEVKDFVKMIAQHPGRACLGRLRRGCFKKVLADTWN